MTSPTQKLSELLLLQIHNAAGMTGVPALVDAYLKALAAEGRQGDYDALVERCRQAEARLGSLETLLSVRRVQTDIEAKRRLG